jgi:hypothetical protein
VIFLYFFLVDHRGYPARLIQQYLNDHKIIAKNIFLILRNNQKADLIILKSVSDCNIILDSDFKFDHVRFDSINAQYELYFKHRIHGALNFVIAKCVWLIEYCIKDLSAKLTSGQLERELGGDPTCNYVKMALMLNNPPVAVITGDSYEPRWYGKLISLMNSKFKDFYFFTPFTPETAISKTFELLKSNFKGKSTTPVSTSKVGTFSESLSVLVKGLSPVMAEHLAENWYRDITMEEIAEILDAAYIKENPKSKPLHHKKLAEKIRFIINKNYMRPNLEVLKLKQDAEHILESEFKETKMSDLDESLKKLLNI